MKKWIALMMLGFASSAMAEDWVEINSDSTMTIYGDVSSRTSNRAWFLLDFKKQQRDSVSEKFYKTAKNLFEASCANNQWRLLFTTYYSQSGQVISSINFEDYGISSWNYVIPDTVSELIYNFVCHQEPR